MRDQGRVLSLRGIFREGALPNHDQAPAHTKETPMRFYNQPHRFYCGIDLHATAPDLVALD